MRRLRYLSLSRSMPVAAALALAACATVPRSIAVPEVQLIGLSLLEASAETQRFRVSLFLSNPNDEPVPVEEVRFAARLSGEGILAGNSAEAVMLPANGSETIRVEVQTDSVSSMSRLLSLVQGPNDALAYELNGNIVVGGRPERLLSFTYRGQVPLSATMGTR